MQKLVLNVGDHVRNIRQNSSRKGWIGRVGGDDGHHYVIVYENGTQQDYLKSMAHISLEKIETKPSQCKCVHDELCERCARQELKAFTHFMRYGGSSKLAEAAWNVLAFERSNGRKVLKRERRNVITGKTQSDMVRDLGHARGVEQFNKRATGRTTGQAFRILGEAMCNPNTAIRVQDVDHAITEHGTPRWSANKHFKYTLDAIIDKMELKGFNFEHGHITYNPIVTEETYVTR